MNEKQVNKLIDKSSKLFDELIILFNIITHVAYVCCFTNFLIELLYNLFQFNCTHWFYLSNSIDSIELQNKVFI